MHPLRNAFRLVALYVIAAATTAHAVSALAGDHRYRVDNPAYVQECASCHVAYPPQLLSQSSWRAVMDGLDRHFGTDASLSPPAASEIGRFLQANAARGKRAARGEGSLRITETSWFTRKHNEVPARTWRHADVRSPANCSACHRQAEQGDFSERSVRMPR